MIIQPDSSAAEKHSPFFKSNQKFSEEFENYILEKDGEVKGNFNAWSYSVIGKISKPNTWILAYKKVTFSSGNLFLSTKAQNVLVSADWKTKNRLDALFFIRKKKPLDRINLLINKSISKLDFTDKYVIQNQGKKSKALTELIQLLKPLFLSGEIYCIDNLTKELKIELRSEHHHFKILEKLIIFHS